ncbi:SDR family NAD(P)-dependent oxidoreductase [Falsihalocynthiibacter sp. BN13B15]|uniref:SDR family NAD(P)-dependent oxidoreductase n=1 Tax=Falsihalocynthiibacter sp. BN13B15 TaxID=3240871 RepID=UPI00350FE86E
MGRPLAEQRVVITGAAHGLGAALARAFAVAGSRLVLIDRDADALAKLGESLSGQVQLIQADLADATATKTAIEKIDPARDPIDTLIHNAAILRPEPFAQVSYATFRATVDVGIQAGYLLSQAVWPQMLNRGGALIFVSSQSGIKGFADETAYCVAKHGLEGLSKCLALEALDRDVVACTITPGMAMNTPMSEQNYPPELKKKWVDPDVLAAAFLHIAQSRDPSFSGQRLNAWELSEQHRNPS